MGSVGAKASTGGALPPSTGNEETKKGLDGNSTIQEVQAYYKDNLNINISDTMANSLGRYTMIEMSQQLDTLYEQLPDSITSMLKQNPLELTFNVNGASYASVSLVTGKLNLNPSLFGKGKHDKLKNDYATDVKFKFHPDNTTHADILTHEIAHHIEYQLTKKLESNSIFGTHVAWTDNVYAKQIVKGAYNDWKASGEIPKGMTEKGARISISGYANAKDKYGHVAYHETIAEAVSDVVRNGDNAKPFSKHVWNNFKSLF